MHVSHMSRSIFPDLLVSREKISPDRISFFIPGKEIIRSVSLAGTNQEAGPLTRGDPIERTRAGLLHYV